MGIYQGLLVTNAFLRTEKFTEHYEWLVRAAARRDVKLDCIDNAQRLFCMEELPHWFAEYDFVIYWDKDIPYGKALTMWADRMDIPVFNTVDAISACDDKYETYSRIATWNLQHPERRVRILRTIPAPMTYANVGYTQLDFLDEVEQDLGYPMVVKECFGSFGMQVYLAKDRQELETLTTQLSGGRFLYQEYHACSAGRDVRMQVVGNQVVAAMERHAAEGDFRANITNGGSMQKYFPSVREQELALCVARILGLDFAGVDFLFAEDGTQADVLCEVNSNAHFKNIHTCTGVNVADAMIDCILKRLERHG